MITAPLPSKEVKRQKAVESYKLLDTLPEQDYDIITTLVASICKVPISLVTLLDGNRNFLKSTLGIAMTESSRDTSFCSHAIVSTDDIFEIEDARLDPRFENNPLVKEHSAIFYAGVPLINQDGYALGTLCVFDSKPRKLEPEQRVALITLAKQVMNLFEARRNNLVLTEIKDELQQRNALLRDFAGIVSHDMKMPLANMIITSDILKAKYGKVMDEQGISYLKNLKNSSLKLSDYITGILNHYESDNDDGVDEEFGLYHLLEDIIELLNINLACDINFPEDDVQLHCNRIALEQVLLNLIGNSLKYNDKEEIIIDIKCDKVDDMYHFYVTDNGMGIPEDKLNTIFDLFTIIGNVDRNGNTGNGIGLSTVRKLVKTLGGDIEVTSELGKYTTFHFTIDDKS